jgi:hypothetical protein
VNERDFMALRDQLRAVADLDPAAKVEGLRSAPSLGLDPAEVYDLAVRARDVLARLVLLLDEEET